MHYTGCRRVTQCGGAHAMGLFSSSQPAYRGATTFTRQPLPQLHTSSLYTGLNKASPAAATPASTGVTNKHNTSLPTRPRCLHEPLMRQNQCATRCMHFCHQTVHSCAIDACSTATATTAVPGMACRAAVQLDAQMRAESHLHTTYRRNRTTQQWSLAHTTKRQGP